MLADTDIDAFLSWHVKPYYSSFRKFLLIVYMSSAKIRVFIYIQLLKVKYHILICELSTVRYYLTWSGRWDLNPGPPAPKAGALSQAAPRPE
jgi:hypothetical protein